MPFNLKADLFKLALLPFRRLERAGPTMEAIHKFFSRETPVKEATDMDRLAKIRSWLLVCFSFWPADFVGIGNWVSKQLAAGHQLDEQMQDMLDGLQDIPSAEAQEIVIAQEKLVETGNHQFLKNNAKYDIHDKATKTNPKLEKEWARIKKLYPVDQYRDPKSGVIRRTMIMERNFRPPQWLFDGDSLESRFRTRFDIFCCKYKLYGVQWDTPLLMKPTITVTALTYEISLPRYAAYDRKRDFNWSLYDDLQAIEETIRSGQKLNETRQVRDAKSLRTHDAHKRGTADGLKGAKLLEYIIEEAELEPTTDARAVLRLRHRAEEILLERETDGDETRAEE